MIRDQKLWTWHLAAGLLILVLLGLHMAIMHLDSLLGIFNPAGGHPIDWENVVARSQSLFFMVSYVLLLAPPCFMASTDCATFSSSSTRPHPSRGRSAGSWWSWP